MELHSWLDEETGRASTLADALGVTKAAVSLWREGGVPMKHMAYVSAHTGGVVTLVAMLDHAIKCRKTKADSATPTPETAQQG